MQASGNKRMRPGSALGLNVLHPRNRDARGAVSSPSPRARSSNEYYTPLLLGTAAPSCCSPLRRLHRPETAVSRLAYLQHLGKHSGRSKTKVWLRTQSPNSGTAGAPSRAKPPTAAVPLIQHRRISPESAEPAHASDHQPSLPDRRRGCTSPRQDRGHSVDRVAARYAKRPRSQHGRYRRHAARCDRLGVVAALVVREAVRRRDGDIAEQDARHGGHGRRRSALWSCGWTRRSP
jgi:hypothetical protein